MKLDITMGYRGNMELGLIMVVVAILLFIIGSRGGGAMDFAIGFLLLILGSSRISKARKAKRESGAEYDEKAH